MSDSTWSYIVKEPRRTEALRELGVSEPVRLLGRENTFSDSLLRFYCQVPHRSSDEQEATGPLVIGIFERNGDMCYGVRRRKGEGELEFVAFSAEAPSAARVLGGSEQALLADLFIDMIENDDARADIEKASAAVGFKYLEQCYELEVEVASLSNPERLTRIAAFLRSL